MEIDILRWIMANSNPQNAASLLVVLAIIVLLYYKYTRHNATRYSKLVNIVDDLAKSTIQLKQEMKEFKDDMATTVKGISKEISELVTATKLLANDQLYTKEAIKKIEGKVFK